MTVYYNEIDPFAATWLVELIAQGQIASGIVDTRSIEDVTPNDLKGFTQCHFFAGIGGWSLALRMAGWPDDRQVWTGSCPCQSFSAAGQGKGFADERHLWPAWFHLINQRQPATIFGEQVDAAIRHGWLDLVQADLEAIGYAIGHSVIPAAGIGAPHGRHRLWFVANLLRSRQSGSWRMGRPSNTTANGQREINRIINDGGSSSMAQHANMSSQDERPSGRQQSVHEVSDGQSLAVEYSQSEQARVSRFARERRKTAGFWANADWIPCRDGKWRPIESGVFPLAHGVPARMDKLRGFGNAIVPQVAAEFVKAYLDS